MSHESARQLLIDPNQVAFYLHRANRKYLLGKKRAPILRHRGLSASHLVLFAMMLVVFAIILRAQFEAEKLDYLELKNHGLVTQGQVTARRVETHPKYKAHFVAYQHVVDGITYCAEQGVSHDHYEMLSDAQPIEILYSPSNPNLSRLAGTNSDPGSVTAIPAAFGALALLLIGYALYRYWRDGRYYKQGITLLGEVTSLRLRNDWRPRYRHDNSIDLVFYPPEQPQKRMERAKLGGYLSPTNAPHKGDTITIFYVDADHWWIL